MKKLNKNFGFTLIELLVVMAIIGILTVIVSGSFVNSQMKSRDSLRKSELKSLADALNMYYTDLGSFPVTINFGGEFLGQDGTIYMKKTPSDSKANLGGHLQFKYVAGSKSFRLYANLENIDDINCNPDCLTGEYNVPSNSGCCYVITSSNIGVTEALK